ncbi:MAG TPA: carboxymuconolactone decarboxylase family protein [Gemmatimonadales bacterium]|nr:carboxymuconolactone decarboxylase family protein [Gemmatimonadales bacterium]
MSERGVPVLDGQTAALVRVAAAVATGRRPELEARLRAARDAGVPALWIEELLLQSMLVVGYPLALVAFGAWRGVNGSAPAPTPERGAEELAHADWQSWAARGEAVCRAVYGRAFHKLVVNLRVLHPALEDLVLVDAYGKVIGRPGLDLKRRELCTVAATAMLGTGEQLHSHLRGALNTGARGLEVEEVLKLVDADLDPEMRRTAWEQWEDVKRRKL